MTQKNYLENTNLLSIRIMLDQLPPQRPGDILNNNIRNQINVGIGVAESLDELRNNPDIMKSQIAIDGEILRLQGALAAYTKEIKGQIEQAIADESTRVNAQAVIDSGLLPDAYAAETRQIVRGMDLGQQLAFMAAAVERGDGAALAAVINVPGHLSGVPAEHRDRFKADFLAQTCNAGQQTQLAGTRDTVGVILNGFDKMSAYTG